MILKLTGHEWVEHFGISTGKGGGGGGWREGGLKMFMPPVVGYGYFLESPNYFREQHFFSYHFVATSLSHYVIRNSKERVIYHRLLLIIYL